MSKISDVFKKTGRKAFIPYVTVGYPSIDATLKIVPLLEASGADIVELGIPFSDPLADGPTIQASSYQSLQQGTTPQICLEVAEKLRAKVNIPLVFMTYFNPVHYYGQDTFCRDSASAGISGLIVPDLPPEEGAELEEASKKHGIDLIYLLAPTSTNERIDMVASRSRGFIYLVSLTGVTGARTGLPPELEDFVGRVRQRTEQPLCVGFGISSADAARRVAKVADGVIVGSRLVQLMGEPDSLNKIADFSKDIRKALNSAEL